jgi:hypothetical protein
VGKWGGGGVGAKSRGRGWNERANRAARFPRLWGCSRAPVTAITEIFWPYGVCARAVEVRLVVGWLLVLGGRGGEGGRELNWMDVTKRGERQRDA